MKTLIITLTIVLSSSLAFAFGDNSYASKPAIEETLRKKEIVKPQPVTTIDRSFVSYQNDPTVLIAKARPHIIQTVIPVAKVNKVEDKVVLKSQICDEYACDLWKEIK